MKPQIDSLDKLIKDFFKLVNLDARREEIKIEYKEAPHTTNSLPKDTQAIYAFLYKNEWLKIGKAGVNSNPRFQYQHYNSKSAGSTLAGSILKDSGFNNSEKIGIENCTHWIKNNTNRVNIYIPKEMPHYFLSLLEIYLHYHLRPRYEGIRQ